ncbi:hypothetical protein DFS34DRAFT_323564 [Phlyctochytrium arcticum]|nr:hypothetical protein DFS34DRAFT_323564 [Phlyctochytrium arcticum]
MSGTAPPSSRETAAAKEILKRLVALVARAYYEPKHIVVLDLLCRVNSQRDEELAKQMRVQAKELHKVCGKLKLDGLIKVEARAELVGPVLDSRPQRKISRSYYYIDYKHFVDVVKFRIYRIGKIIEKEVQEQIANMPYKCPNCGREYSALDFAMLDKTENMIPLCDVCKIEIQQGTTGTDATGTSEKYTRFMSESQPIVDLLKQTDKMVIPEWVTDVDGQDAAATAAMHERELAYSQELGAAIGSIVIEVESGGEEEEFEEVKEEDALAKYYSTLQSADSPSSSDTGKRKHDDDNDEPIDGESPTKKLDTGILNGTTTKTEIAVLDDDEFEDEDFEEV